MVLEKQLLVQMQEDETRSEAVCIMKRRGGARCRSQEMVRKERRLVRKVNYRTGKDRFRSKKEVGVSRWCHTSETGARVGPGT